MSPAAPAADESVRHGLGACTSVFGHRDALSAGKLRELAATGIAWVEVAALQTQHVNLFDGKRVDELVAAVEGLPLGVWSLHAPFCGLAMDDAGTRADGLRKLRQAVAVARRFGATAVVVHPGRDVPSVDRRRELSWMREGLERAAADLPPGMVLAVETMGARSLAGPAEEMLEVVGELPADRVGICLDTGHVNQGGDPAAYAAAVAGRIVSVHLHDNAGDRDAHALPGEGNIDWPACLDAIRRAGYRGPWMCEAGIESSNLSAAETVGEFVRRMAAYLSQSSGV